MVFYTEIGINVSWDEIVTSIINKSKKGLEYNDIIRDMKSDETKYFYIE